MMRFVPLLIGVLSCSEYDDSRSVGADASEPAHQVKLGDGNGEEEVSAATLRVNKYLPITLRTFESDVPVDAATLTVISPCTYMGSVSLRWDVATQLGVFEHDTLLTNDQFGCPAEAVQTMVDAAASAGGILRAKVSISLVEAYQFGYENECYRGHYETLALSFDGDELVFQNYAYRELDILGAAECVALISIAGL
jgi:hypothetical protein